MNRRNAALVAAVLTSVALLGAKCNGGNGKGTVQGIPANYYANLKAGEKLPWPTRDYKYCFVADTFDPKTNQKSAALKAINDWISGMNALIKSAPQGINAGPLFTATDVGVGPNDTCSVPGDTPIPGVAKWLVVDHIDGGNVGYTNPITSPSNPNSLSATVTELLTAKSPLMQIDGFVDDAKYNRTCEREAGHSIAGIFGSVQPSDADIPLTTANQPNVMGGVSAQTALPSQADLTTGILIHQSIQ